MKTKLIFAVLFSAFLFNSCSNSSSSDDSPSIIGTWKYSREGSVVNGEEVLTPYTGNQDGCDKDKSEFKADGTIIDTYYTSTCDAVGHSGTYTKSGSTITTTFSDGSFTFTILKLTSTVLKVKNSDGDILEFIK
ncbi:lipocalin family protein [Flavobacterium sp.]|uniref:lipocalin family protein n=1 Tax=Flavobacterium sp. TaxID=239 RepID=UPI002FDB5B65